ncbi:MAG TPA: hypothetical protein VG714_09440 [Acidobacteriaceae bacterium]|nr:hypothetical protein [Acidobacteriaceae bacterium]
MNLQTIILVPLLTIWAIGQAPSQNKPLPNNPKAFVQSLYTQVVARHPYGILSDAADKKTFHPYLSGTLLHKIVLAGACSKDWVRQNRGRVIKAPFGWSESGPFSGANERGDPRAFAIEKIEPEKDGSYRVYVSLKWWEASDKNADIYQTTPSRPDVWRVAAVVVRENAHLAIDDVIYLKDKDLETEYRLTEVLSEGCDGTHWVGYREH